MKKYCFIFILLILVLLTFCSDNSNPVRKDEIEFSPEVLKNFDVKQTSYNSFRIKTNNGIILPDTMVSSIVYSDAGRNGFPFSYEIPFGYSEHNDGFLLDFSYRRQSFNADTTIDFKITYFLNTNKSIDVDSSIFIHNLTAADVHIVLNFTELGDDFPQATYHNYDISGSRIFFSTYRPKGLFEYNINTKQVHQLLSSEVGIIASDNQYVFYNLDRDGVYRYNLDSSKTDLKLDLSQLEYNVGERNYCYGMSIFSDTLTLVFWNDAKIDFEISYFTKDGAYLSSLTMEDKAGYGGGYEKYGNLLFLFSDTGPYVWDFESDIYYTYSIPTYGCWGGQVRIKRGYKYDNFYFSDSDATFIGRISMDKIINVLF